MTEKQPRSPRNAGRPPIIAPSITENVVRALNAGNYMETAAAYAGISKDTLYRWLKRGEREKRRREDTPLPTTKKARAIEQRIRDEEEPYLAFSDAIEKALADSEVRQVGIIAKAATGGTVLKSTTTAKADGSVVKVEEHAPPQWQAAAWQLERKHPDRWGLQRKVKVEIDTEVQKELEAALAKLEAGLTPDEFSKVLGLLADEGPGEGEEEAGRGEG
jgi:hypothetical protein